MNLQAILSLFTHISIDWVILVCFALLVALDAMRAGLSRATALALALPLTLMLSGFAQQAALIAGFEEQLSSPALQEFINAGLLVVILILMYSNTDNFSADSYHPLQALLAGLAVAAIATVVWLQLPALDTVWHFGPTVQAVFGASYRFWWLLAGYLALAFARG